MCSSPRIPSSKADVELAFRSNIVSFTDAKFNPLKFNEKNSLFQVTRVNIHQQILNHVLPGHVLVAGCFQLSRPELE